MSITFSMLNNRLYKIDKWLVGGNKVFIVLLFVAISASMLQFESTMFYGIGLMTIICLWTFYVRVKVVDGQLKFDKSIYNVPEIGDKLIVKKTFKYDFSKVKNSKNYIHDKCVCELGKNWSLEVYKIEELSDNWIITLELFGLSVDPLYLEMFYLDIKDKFTTLEDIRDEKLKKLLK